jgi:SAM-dependent methyltransferase
MSAFAMMYFQDPSLLAFQRKLQNSTNLNNLKTMFDVKSIPRDSQLRDVLDPLPTDILEKIFPDYLSQLQRGKHLQNYQFLNGMYLMPLDDLGKFDLIWVRFVLEYNRLKSFDIVKNISGILKPGGILCLIDLDCNCLRHFGHSKRLERTICGIMSTLEKDADFDPYAGIKLYSYLYDLGYQDIDVNISPHHLIFGRLKEKDAYNWTMKVKVAARNSGYGFEEYGGDYKEFFKEVESFLADPRRFIYTPLISCRGRKPHKR